MSEDALKDAFVFTYDRMRRYEGAWHLERQMLFPGYVFLESKDMKCLQEELKRYPRIFQRGKSSCPMVPLEPEEERFLRKLYGREHHSQMSRGYIRNGQTFVTEGPLQGKEYLIRRLDRHKRIAWIGMPVEEGKRQSETRDVRMLRRDRRGLQEIQVGLEIVSKT